MSAETVLQDVEKAIVAGAPQLQAIEADVNEVAGVVETLVPAAAPIVAGIEAAEPIVNEVVKIAGETVAAINGGVPPNQSMIPPSAPVTTTIGGLPVPPVPASESVPASPVANPATVAAAGVASASAHPDAILARIQALENGMVQLLPIVGGIAKKFGI